MPARYSFEQCRDADDAALRQLLRDAPMQGRVKLSFQREPSFLAAERIGAIDSQVVVVRDRKSGRIAGYGTRSFRRVYVDGKPTLVGYLSGLRGLPEHRGGTLLARGYRFLRQLHADRRVPFYFTTILDDNQYPKTILTSGRAGLPVYREWGRLITYLVPLFKRVRASRGKTHLVRGPSGALLSSAAESIAEFNKKHQFAPVYKEIDLAGSSGLLPGFSAASDLYCTVESEKVTATLGLWDQGSCKQTVVLEYPTLLRMTRPLSSMGYALGLTPRLPRSGETVPFLFGSFISHRPGAEAAFAELLDAATRDWSRRGFLYLAIGLHEDNPLRTLVEPHSADQLVSTMYTVYWPDLLERSLPTEGQVPHLEIATL